VEFSRRQHFSHTNQQPWRPNAVKTIGSGTNCNALFQNAPGFVIAGEIKI
jgi:hypothetical protein